MGGWARREFLKFVGLTGAGLAFSRMPLMAGPFDELDWNQIIPADKKLHPDWVKSLFARGTPQIYTKANNELCYIGMPVGGICCGTVYLSGDGRLWNWDIFNQDLEGTLPTSVPWQDIGMDFGGTKADVRNRDGSRYVRPATPDDSPKIAQGFALQIIQAGKTEVRPLHAAGWAEVDFTGQYPIGTVEYSDTAAPVSVKLEAFSPFIPLHAEDSGLPATVFHFTVTNRSAETTKVNLAGWLQNAASLYSAKPASGPRVNSVRHGQNSTCVAMRFEKATASMGVDPIVQTDRPETEVIPEDQPDFGTMALAVIGGGAANPDVDAAALPAGAFVQSSLVAANGAVPIGSVAQEKTIAAGQSVEFRFVVAWHFPNSRISCPDARTGNYYARRFSDASAVADYVVAELPRLESLTRLWRDTWYDSTLPHWFLDRTFANTSTLATTTSHRFGSGRFWGWEGVGCCGGTCTHVWHYAQAVGRIFPEIERDLRERVDFGAAFNPTEGVVRFRGEGTGPAIDGQCGRILGVWREYQMSADGAFLKRIWPNVRRALEYVMEHDKDGDGILDGAQENTLDAAWYGQIAWITSLALAALRAGEAMAKAQGDKEFAERCHTQYQTARASVETKLFNGEYFFQIADPKRAKSLGTYEACHIDQVHGQSWAWQVNLGRVLDREKTLSALRALWKYNFAPDVGPFRKIYTAGRPYALAGDAGLVMATNPKLIKDVYGLSSWQIGYFNECMSGFEHQVASHMMAEGMILESLAITRAIHDRYHASRRNPWNEVECSDHYARAMASYGTFITACGFEYDGPRQHIGFAPRLTPENFKCAFTSAEGWGSFSQKHEGKQLEAEIAVRFGTLNLKTIALVIPDGASVTLVKARVGQTEISAALKVSEGRVLVTFAEEINLSPRQALQITLS
jgi:uncharacterized protein (DUF608 family)